MINLSFEELMEKAINAKKDNNINLLIDINEEFNRRVKKRILMGKKPIKTSIAGQKQTLEWIKNDNVLFNQELNKKTRAKNSLKIKAQNLRNDTDISKKKSLW